ncbi:MAG: hypothetical protein PHG96_12285 [Kiritimatiellae bacterium]|nr:hypothetical protein [Kiritimatiellia bacterium]
MCCTHPRPLRIEVPSLRAAGEQAFDPLGDAADHACDLVVRRRSGGMEEEGAVFDTEGQIFYLHL